MKRYSLCLILSLVFCVQTASAEFIADGAKLVPLTSDGKSTAIAWSYHGDRIVYLREVSGTQKQLIISKSDGTKPRAITPIGNPFFAEWSWSGTKLAYLFSNADSDESQAQAYVYDLLTNRSIPISAPYPKAAFDEDDGPFFSPDDNYVVYKVRPGASRSRQIWVADTASGSYWRIIAQKGEGKDARWNFSLPPKICLLVQASAGGWDVATVTPDGRDFAQLTNVGIQSVRTDNPRWSPVGQWIAFKNNLDMTQNERDNGIEDCWIVKPDGSDARNLTNASSPATEKQLNLEDLIWSWDGRWILADGKRYDIQGNEIHTLYLIDPVNGGYEIIMTSYPRKTSEYLDINAACWSYDSSKIAVLARRMTVRNWGPDADDENVRYVLILYDMRSRKAEDILLYNRQADRKKLPGHTDRDKIENISWSPDNRSILLTISDIVSAEDDIYKPNVYRLDLPARFIDSAASQHIGPPVGSAVAKPPSPQPEQTQPTPPAAAKPPMQPQQPPQPAVQPALVVTETIAPLHMTVEEAIASLPDRYSKYFTVNTTRNFLLFKGPADVLTELRKDLKLLDTEPPHILVDLLAVELSDEANRELGLDWTYAQGHFAFYQPVGNPIQKFSHTSSSDSIGFPSGALDTLSSVSGVGQAFFQGVGTLPSEFFIRLNTLIRNGQGSILANPRTVATSGKESLIKIQKTLNYFFNEGFDTAGRPIVKKSDITADTEGRITPTLLADGRIHLLVDISVGSFTFSPDAGLPERTDRKATTEVTVNQHETIVIGGLRQEEMTSSATKVPILGDLPFLGPLFKRQEKAVKNTVLTIFITPQVMNSHNPMPEWPQLKSQDHRMVPIMKDDLKASEEE